MRFEEKVNNFIKHFIENANCSKCTNVEMFYISDCAKYCIIKHGGHYDKINYYRRVYYELHKFDLQLIRNKESMIERFYGRLNKYIMIHALKVIKRRGHVTSSRVPEINKD